MATSVTSTHIFGTKDVASAGTRVQLDSNDYKLVSLLMIAHSDNGGRIYYGGSDVASSTQFGLEAGESVTIPAPVRGNGIAPFNLSEIYIDTSNSGDGVDFVGARAL